MLVYYSIGNFINSTAETGSGIADRMLGAMATVTIEKDESGGAVKISDYGVIPLVTHVKIGQAQITTYKLSDYTQEMAAQMKLLQVILHFRWSTVKISAKTCLKTFTMKVNKDNAPFAVTYGKRDVVQLYRLSPCSCRSQAQRIHSRCTE